MDQLLGLRVFLQVASSPLTRSSYHAGEDFFEDEKKTPDGVESKRTL